MRNIIGMLVICMISIFIAFVIAGSMAAREKLQWQEEYINRELVALERQAELIRIAKEQTSVAKESLETLNACTGFLLEIENELRVIWDIPKADSQ